MLRRDLVSRHAGRRLLAGGALAIGALAATTVPAHAAVTATFNAGVLTVSGDSLDNVNLESVSGAELLKYCDITRSAVTESMIVTDQQLLHPETPAQYELHEFLCAVACELMRERHYREVIHSSLGDDFELFFRSREKKGGG